eukprot:CAMPEP_0117480328 /NCGR_PEP_ID=MMETSP0784-20121206/12336_1 /TAXON_ID=39447 /ORGANISM="" /LENGTH=266 /DNA_ID=CAMNT_0005274767 /DNA_START=20 /DNA_END=819 /DNA_ORIENTATION=+
MHSHGAIKGPYLPHPYPLKHVGRLRESRGGEFVSLQDSCRPHGDTEKPCGPERSFMSYGEWWQVAHQPPPPAPPGATGAKSTATNLWPYGRQVTDLITTDHQGDAYVLEQRVLHNVVPYKPRRDAANRASRTGELVMRRSESATNHFGSHNEAQMHYGGNLTRAQSSAHVAAGLVEQPTRDWRQGASQREAEASLPREAKHEPPGTQVDFTPSGNYQATALEGRTAAVRAVAGAQVCARRASAHAFAHAARRLSPPTSSVKLSLYT